MMNQHHRHQFASFKDLQGYFRKRYGIPNAEYQLWENAHRRLLNEARKEKELETAIPSSRNAVDPHTNRNQDDDNRE